MTSIYGTILYICILFKRNSFTLYPACICTTNKDHIWEKKFKIKIIMTYITKLHCTKIKGQSWRRSRASVNATGCGFCSIFFFSFTLYTAQSRVGRRNLVLRHSVPHFLQNSGGIACWVAELNCLKLASTPERRNGIITLSKYFTSSSEDRTHNQ